MKKYIIAMFTSFFIMLAALNSFAADAFITMSTTTSTESSGMLNILLPEFKKDSGIDVKVIAKGTGAAIRDGIDGNVDIIFVHAIDQEEKFVADGYGAYRLAVMHNDFVIIGPESDPAGIKDSKNAKDALIRIAEKKTKFISRGDDSGTHIKEQDLWKATGLSLIEERRDVIKSGNKAMLSFVHPGGLGDWYMSIGQGMGNTLTFAEEKQAYALTDRGTYLQYKFGRPQGLDLEIICEGDPELFNPYGIIPVSPKKHPHVKFDMAEKFAKWLVSEKGQNLIANYKIEGKQAFFPDAL